MKEIKTIVFIVGVLFVVACTSDGKRESYKAEAVGLCEVFNPKNWTDLPKNIEPIEIQKKLTDRMSKAIKSGEMQRIISSMPKVKIDLRYQFFVEKVSQLIGEPFECQAMKDYMTIKI